MTEVILFTCRINSCAANLKYKILLRQPHPIATLIPTLGAARFDARGELRLVERLKDCLEGNAWIWHNIQIRKAGAQHSDSGELW